MFKVMEASLSCSETTETDTDPLLIHLPRIVMTTWAIHQRDRLGKAAKHGLQQVNPLTYPKRIVLGVRGSNYGEGVRFSIMAFRRSLSSICFL